MLPTTTLEQTTTPPAQLRRVGTTTGYAVQIACVDWYNFTDPQSRHLLPPSADAGMGDNQYGVSHYGVTHRYVVRSLTTP